MTRENVGPVIRDPRTSTVQRLRPNAIGLTAVIFMAVATAAPITAMVGNVPIAIGFGNGIYAPAGYLVATIVLSLFALGYSAMAKHITATGAFYGFISYGLGRVIGLVAGAGLTTLGLCRVRGIAGGDLRVLRRLASSTNHAGAVDLPWLWSTRC